MFIIEFCLELLDSIIPSIRTAIILMFLPKKNFEKSGRKNHEKFRKNHTFVKITEFTIRLETDFEIEKPEIGRVIKLAANINSLGK